MKIDWGTAKLLSVVAVLTWTPLCLTPLAVAHPAPVADEVPTEKAVEALLKAKPKSYEAHYNAGRLYESRGFYGQAQDEYRQAITFSGVKPDAYKRLAQLALKSSDYATAEKVSTEGLHHFPRDYGMLLTAGFVLHNQSKLAPALNMYRRAREAKPDDGQICIAIADVLAAMNKPEEALAEIARFEKLSKPDVLSIYEKAKIYLAMKKFDLALAELDKNYNADPANFANNKLYATTLANRDKKDKALEVAFCLLANSIGAEMEMSKKRVSALLGQVQPGAVPQVLANAQKRLKDNKIKARMHFALGDVYDRKTQMELAISQYREGLKLDESFARGHFRLAQDLERHRKDIKGAYASYKRAHELDPNKDREISSKWLELNKGKAK